MRGFKTLLTLQLSFRIPCLQLPFELGVLDVSAVSVTTGVLSVVAVLPGATMISFLFRLHEVKLTRSGAQHAKDGKTDKDYFEGDIQTLASAQMMT